MTDFIQETCAKVNRWIGQEVERRLEAMIPIQWQQVLRNATDEIKWLQAEMNGLEKLLESRTQVLRAIPPCPAHGQDCVEHALEWINKRRGKR